MQYKDINELKVNEFNKVLKNSSKFYNTLLSTYFDDVINYEIESRCLSLLKGCKIKYIPSFQIEDIGAYVDININNDKEFVLSIVEDAQCVDYLDANQLLNKDILLKIKDTNIEDMNKDDLDELNRLAIDLSLKVINTVEGEFEFYATNRDILNEYLYEYFILYNSLLDNYIVDEEYHIYERN